MFTARPMPVSSIPPDQTGMPRDVGVAEDPERLEEPADAPLLQVEDPAAAEGDRRARIGEVVDRFVEAERRRELLLEERVLVEVAVGERLLDHREAEGVEPREVRGVLEPVVAVGVDHQRDVGEALAYGRDVLDVLPLLDLHLDPVVAARDCRRDLADERRPGVSWIPMLMPGRDPPPARRRGARGAGHPSPSRRGRRGRSRPSPSPSGSRGRARSGRRARRA